MVFKKRAIFSPMIGENKDYNIDPRSKSETFIACLKRDRMKINLPQKKNSFKPFVHKKLELI
jgi:hypothetical protein